MPFTVSHAVVALPFLRTPLVPAAIAAGAVAPDLPLFLPTLPFSYQDTHTNVVVSAVIAAVLLGTWYVLVRPTARELSPAPLARRLPARWDPVPWRRRSRPRLRVTWIALSILLGVVTHLVWDAFTHAGRWGVRAVPALSGLWGPVPGYTWLQHGSSAAGVVILLVCAVVWFVRADRQALDRVLPGWVRWAWWLSLPAILAVTWIIGMLVLGPLTAQFTAQHLAYRVLPPAAGAWAVLTLMLCVVVRAWLRVRNGP